MDNKPTSSPKNESPSSPATATPTPKNFQREGSAPPATAKRGPGRPRKDSAPAGGKSASAAPTPPAVAVTAPVKTAYADPAPMSAPMAVKGLLQAMTPIAGMVTAMATKIELIKAIEIWRFSETELNTIAKPGGAFMEKYAPSLDAFGVEIEFAGAVFQVVFPKVLAIVAAKKIIEAADKKKNPPAENAAAEPAKPTPAPTPIRVVPTATPQPATASPLTSEDFEIEVEPSLPSPFDPQFNHAMPAAAAAVGGL